MKIRFTKDALYENEGRNKGTLYKAGEVHDFDQAFAERWLRRGVAEQVKPRTPAKDDAPAAPVTPDQKEPSAPAKDAEASTAGKPADGKPASTGSAGHR
jgi:hypothetical protein